MKYHWMYTENCSQRDKINLFAITYLRVSSSHATLRYYSISAAQFSNFLQETFQSHFVKNQWKHNEIVGLGKTSVNYTGQRVAREVYKWNWYSTSIESTNNSQPSNNKYNIASVHYKSDIISINGLVVKSPGIDRSVACHIAKGQVQGRGNKYYVWSVTSSRRLFRWFHQVCYQIWNRVWLE